MVGYFKGKSLPSRLIKWRTWGDFSHVAWITGNSFDWYYLDPEAETNEITIPAGTVYESWHKKDKGAKRNGVRKGVAGTLHKPGTPIDLYMVKISDSQYNQGITCLEDLVKDPKAKYDWRGTIAGFMLRKNSAHGRRSLFCSRLLMRFFQHCGIKVLINIKEWQTSPVDLSRSPLQVYVGTWITGSPFPDFNLPEDWR